MRMLYPAIALALTAGLAHGAEDDARQVQFQVTPHAKYVLSADLKSGGGNVSVFRGGLDVQTQIPIAERGEFGIGVTSELSHYRFSDAAIFGTGPKPVSNTQEYELTASYRHQFDDRWSGFAAAGINYSGESGADFNKSLTYGGALGATYKVSDSLRLGLGVIARTRLEQSAWVLPLPLITWNISDQWTFSTERKNATLTFAPVEQWKFFLAVDGDVHEYRLDTSSASSKGVFRDTAVLVSLGATFDAHKNVSITAGVGANLYREMRLDDMTGNRIAKTKADPSAVLYVSAMVHF